MISSRSKRSSKSDSSRSNKSSDSALSGNKDNEDPNSIVPKLDQFDPKELRQVFDGWHLYKKNKISLVPVRRYQIMVD